MLTLGIETSCDETGLALVHKGRLLAQVLASQADLHSLFGGVVPEMASREHYRMLSPLLDELLTQAHISIGEVEVVAAARGPGLLGALLVGLGFAKGLAMGCGARLLGVDHLHAHLLAAGLERGLIFPAIGLLVSGGHTHLYRLHSALELEVLGRTLDDAAGEAYDKVAKMLNLPYPGGKFLDGLAHYGIPVPGLFPRPYLDNKNLDFSFSGLKTAVAEYLKKYPEFCQDSWPEEPRIGDLAERNPGLADMCASFNESVAETLRIKVERALDRHQGVKSLILAGGVAANSRIRQTMSGVAAARELEFFLPSLDMCTDNAAMVAYLGELLAEAGYSHNLDVDAVPRGQVVPWDFKQMDS